MMILDNIIFRRLLPGRLVFALTLGVCASLQAAVFDGIDVVPATGLKMDGSLAEWNQNGLIDTYYDETLSPLYGMTVGFAYDAGALYIGAHFADDTPMVNAHGAADAAEGAQSDSLRVRLAAGPSRQICLTIWYNSASHQPMLTVQDGGAVKTIMGSASGFVFAKDRDGEGYTLEGRVPWTLLNFGKNLPKAGDKFPLTLEATWGDDAGRIPLVVLRDIARGSDQWTMQDSWGTAVLAANGKISKRLSRKIAESENPIITQVKIPDASATSISGAVFSSTAGLVRTLDPIIRDDQETGGEAEFVWDGADDMGVPLPPGDYTLKALTHRGIGQRFVASVNTSGNPPYQSEDGKGAWGGDEAPPVAAAAGNDRVYLGWAWAEGSVRFVCVEDKIAGPGEPPVTVFRSNSGVSGGFPSALAVQGDKMFVAYDCIGAPNEDVAYAVRVSDAATGQAIAFPFGKKEIPLGGWKKSLDEFDDKPLYERIQTGDLGPLQFREGPVMSFNLIGLSVHDDLVAVSAARDDKVILANWKTGEKAGEFSVKRPTGLQFEKDGKIVVASGNDLLRLDPATGQTKPLAAGVLDNPWGMALDAAGNIFVSNCGRTMAVKVFSPDGKFLRTVGKVGGRPWEGAFDENGMLMPAGLTVDGEGKLWVTEWDNSPRRVSVWDKDGKFVADYFGPSHPQKSQSVVPWDPTLINVSNAEFQVDYATGKWKCLSTLYRPCLTGLSPNSGLAAWNALQQSYIFRQHDGKEYAIATAYNSRYGVIFRRDGARLKPITSIGNGLGLPLVMQAGDALGNFHFDPVDFLTPEQYKAYYDPVKRKAKAFWEVWHDWVDKNGDGLMQKDEYSVEPLSFGELGLTRVQYVDEDMTLWLYSTKKGIIPLRVESWTPDGIPIYPKMKDWKPLFAKVTSAGDEPLLVDLKKKRIYSTDNKGATAIARGEWQAYSCYDFEGKCLWMYRPVWLGFARDAPLWRPGLLIGANTFAGLVDVNDKLDVIGICGYYGNYYLLSSDGLWVSQVCYDNRLGPRPGPNVQFIENFTGALFRSSKDGKAYFLGGDVDCRIWEITGLETIKTTEAPLKIEPAGYELAQEAARRKSEKVEKKTGLVLAPLPAARVDGEIAEWNFDKDSVTVDAGAGRKWKAKMGYDDKNLYVAFQVMDASPLLNDGPDAPLLFKSGDACDIMLAVDPAADPARTKPVAGDFRLLFTTMGGKPVCELYEAVNKTSGPDKAFEFKSPTGQEHFDRVEALPTANVITKKTADGYIVEAAVPLSALGFNPKAGMKIRGDLGVLFSTDGGGRTILRSYYSNKETGTIEDIPSESRLYPDKWTEIEVQ